MNFAPVCIQPNPRILAQIVEKAADHALPHGFQFPHSRSNLRGRELRLQCSVDKQVIGHVPSFQLRVSRFKRETARQMPLVYF